MVDGRERRTLMQDDIFKRAGDMRSQRVSVENQGQGHSSVSIPRNLQGGRASVNPKSLKVQL